jgi:hypothetical protein
LREKEELEKSVEEKWQTPADFMMG